MSVLSLNLKRFLKRLIDIVFSLALLVVLFPVLLSISLTIKIGTGGPVFFIQKRYGKNRTIFNIIKFCTITPDDNDPVVTGDTVLNLDNEGKITKIGKYLRKTGLDELPQLVNVLIGEMSLVGPRPITIAETDFLSEHFLIYLQVQPGITGLWQLNRSNKHRKIEHKHEKDSYYIENWSLKMDCSIMLRTIYLFVRLLLLGR